MSDPLSSSTKSLFCPGGMTLKGDGRKHNLDYLGSWDRVSAGLWRSVKSCAENNLKTSLFFELQTSALSWRKKISAFLYSASWAMEGLYWNSIKSALCWTDQGWGETWHWDRAVSLRSDELMPAGKPELVLCCETQVTSLLKHHSPFLMTELGLQQQSLKGNTMAWAVIVSISQSKFLLLKLCNHLFLEFWYGQKSPRTAPAVLSVSSPVVTTPPQLTQH